LHDLGLDDADVVTRFERFLDQLPPGHPFAGIVHLRGTHYPFHCPPAWSRFGDEHLTDRYDDSIRYADQNQARILTTLARRGRLADTLIISTADHGEAMREHGYSGHAHTFYNEEARVPLWVFWPEALGAAPESWQALGDTPVSNADVLPTVLDALALWQTPALGPHQTPLTGSPLSRPPPKRALVLQNQADSSGQRPFGGAAVVTRTHKYLLRVEGDEAWEEYYALDDSHEATDLWSRTPASERQAVYDTLEQFPLSKAARAKIAPNPSPVQGRLSVIDGGHRP
jgi:arylsulfatase A-like enzyme